MSKIYNYRTGKLYESEGSYKITVSCRPLSNDVTVDNDDNGMVDDIFTSFSEAKDTIKDVMISSLFDNEGISEEDAEVIDNRDGYVVTVPEYKEWTFVVSDNITESTHTPFRQIYNDTYDGYNADRLDFDYDPEGMAYDNMNWESSAEAIEMEKHNRIGGFDKTEDQPYIDALNSIFDKIEVKCPDLYNEITNREWRFGRNNEMKGRLVIDMGTFILVNGERLCDEGIDSLCDEMIKLLDYDGCCVEESVSSRFSRLRSIYEASDDNDGEDNDKNNDDEDNDSDDEEGGDDEDDKKGDDEDGDGDDDEEAELKAVLVTVYKKDKDKFKDELVDAGISEDDIEILEDDDDDEDDDEATVDFRIDAGSILELKDYLEKKGIDLEEKIGGEIVDDDEDGDDKDGEEGGDEGGDKEGGDDDENEIDNLDFGDLGDIFGGDNSGEEK